MISEWNQIEDLKEIYFRLHDKNEQSKNKLQLEANAYFVRDSLEIRQILEEVK